MSNKVPGSAVVLLQLLAQFGVPRHPLMLDADLRPQPWAPR